jgi:hypothetical protein
MIESPGHLFSEMQIIYAGIILRQRGGGNRPTTSLQTAPERNRTRCSIAALRKTGFVALAQIAMHRREHVAVIRAVIAES